MVVKYKNHWKKPKQYSVQKLLEKFKSKIELKPNKCKGGCPA